MKLRNLLLCLVATIGLSGCQLLDSAFFSCHGRGCQSSARSSSSLVSFLYPKSAEPPTENSIPQLNLPVRVGLAFIPETSDGIAAGLEASQREEILERIR